MARGWESKSVAQQQEEARSETANNRQRLTPDQIAAEQHRRSLELSRSRIVQQLQRATNSRHREMLEAALKDLDRQLQNES